MTVMRIYELATLPVRLGIKPVKWAGGVVIEKITQAAPSNIVEVWRQPWETEIDQHLADARQQRDYQRAEEQRALLECIHCYAPRTAEELEELRTTAGEKPQESLLDEVLGPTASPPPTD